MKTRNLIGSSVVVASALAIALVQPPSPKTVTLSWTYDNSLSPFIAFDVIGTTNMINWYNVATNLPGSSRSFTNVITKPSEFYRVGAHYVPTHFTN